MSSKDTIAKKYLSRNDIFADVVNFKLFDGKQVIKENDLEQKDITELSIFQNSVGKLISKQKLRDVLKRCTVKMANHVTYLLIGIENQSEIHYAMVVRNMLYDSLNYTTQVEEIIKKNRENKKNDTKAEFLSGFTKSDKLLPVVTITILWNPEKWDGAKNLHEMFGDVDRQILNYVPNYSLNLIAPSEIEDFSRFASEIREVLEIISVSNDKEKLGRLLADKRFSSLDNDTGLMIQGFTNIKKPKAKGGKVDMCKGLELLLEDRAKEAASVAASAAASAAMNDTMDKMLKTLMTAMNCSYEDVLKMYGVENREELASAVTGVK